MSEQSGSSLTGVWQGVYAYPQGDSVPFLATLIESGPFVTGSTQESCAAGPGLRISATALIDGTRGGSRVEFRKTYDGSAGWDHMVSYDGAINPDGSEIEGAWRLSDGTHGRFLMRRERRKAKEVEVRKLTDVEA